jgi:hypothetical protein
MSIHTFLQQETLNFKQKQDHRFWTFKKIPKLGAPTPQGREFHMKMEMSKIGISMCKDVQFFFQKGGALLDLITQGCPNSAVLKQ